MVAQAIVFLSDGFQVSTTVVAYTLIEIAANPNVLSKLQREVDEAYKKHNNEIT